MGLNSSGPQKLPTPILEGIPMTQIASGADHFVCLSADGQVYTCGCAEQGQLGRVAEVFSNRGGRKGKDYLLTPQPVALGKGKKRIVIDNVWTGSYATFARAKETGLIYVFGLNNYNQLGTSNSKLNIRMFFTKLYLVLFDLKVFPVKTLVFNRKFLTDSKVTGGVAYPVANITL